MYFSLWSFPISSIQKTTTKKELTEGRLSTASFANAQISLCVQELFKKSQNGQYSKFFVFFLKFFVHKLSFLTFRHSLNICFMPVHRPGQAWTLPTARFKVEWIFFKALIPMISVTKWKYWVLGDPATGVLMSPGGRSSAKREVRAGKGTWCPGEGHELGIVQELKPCHCFKTMVSDVLYSKNNRHKEDILKRLYGKDWTPEAMQSESGLVLREV